MRRAVIHDPENSPGVVIGGLGHNLLHKPIKGGDAIFWLATTKQLDPVDIKGSQIGPRPASFVFVFQLHRRAGLGSIGGMSTAACLDAGLFIGRQNKLVVPKRAPVPHSFIQIQNSPGFDRELPISGENPRPILPRSNGVLMEPAPYSALTDGGYKTGLPSLPGKLSNAPSGKRHLMGRW